MPITIAAGATLETFGARVSGAFFGGGFLRVTGVGSQALLTGTFGNVEVFDGAARLEPATSIIGLSVRRGTCTVRSGCQAGSLSISPRGSLVLDPANTAPFTIIGNLFLNADLTGTGTINSHPTQPLIAYGTRHTVAGDFNGPLRLRASAPATVLFTGSLDRLELDPAGSRVTIDGLGTGLFDGELVNIAPQPNPPRAQVTFLNLRADYNRNLTPHNTIALALHVAGTVTVERITLQDALLSGDESATLNLRTIGLAGGSWFGPAPGTTRLGGFAAPVTNINNFQPVRGTIIIDTGGTLAVSVQHNTPMVFNNLEVSNNSSVFISTYGGPDGPPIANANVIHGSLAISACRLLRATIGGAGSLDASAACSLGDVVLRGHATLDTDTRFDRIPANLSIETGGSVAMRLAANTSQVTIGGAAVLRIAQGASLQFTSPGTGLVVTPTGRLVLDGTPTSPALITGTNYFISLGGAVDARSFRIAGIYSGGVSISSTATFGPAPFDFRGGHFTGGQSGGVFLDVQRPSATTFFDLDFDDTVSVRNIRTTAASAPITVVDSRGNRGGAASEDDPAGRITWRANATSLAAFSATPRVHRNLLAIRTITEETAAFRIVRLPGTALPTIPATGPGFYNAVDDGLLAGTRYSYGLDRQRWSPFLEWVRISSTIAAAPHAANEGITRFVGPNGYASIAAALTAAPPGTIVAVEPGTYGGFTMTQPGRVIGVGSTVAVTGPIVVQNINAPGTDVALTGLAAQGQVTLSNVSVPVLLRSLTLSSATQPVLSVNACPKVAVEQLSTAGNVAISAASVYAWNSSFGRTTLTQSSRFVYAGTSVISVTPDATSTARNLSGTVARVSASALWPSGSFQNVNLTSATAGHAAVLILSDGHDLLDLSATVPFDMALLLPLGRLYTVWSGVIGTGGSVSVPIPGPPDASLAGFGLTFQAVTLDPTTAQGRFGEALPVVMLR